jgi:hypothetical protein
MDHAAAPTNAEFEEEDLPRFPTSGATAEEEEEFGKELAKMIAETSSPSVPTESSTTGARKGERNPIAGNLFSDKGLPILKTLIQPSTKQDPLDKQGEAMTFTMLTKKGNKQQVLFTLNKERFHNLADSSDLFPMTSIVVENHANSIQLIDCCAYPRPANAQSSRAPAAQKVGLGL